MKGLNRAAYLSDDVADFRDWLAKRLEGEPIHFPQTAQSQYLRLHDALGQYAWPNRRRPGLPKSGHPYRLPLLPAMAAKSSFAENGLILARLQKVLRRAFHHHPVNPQRLAGAVAAVLYWGGVFSEPRPGGGNKGWLAAQGRSLHATLQDVVAQVGGGTDEYAGSGPLHFSAGTTKVYALLLDDFIIYDSRVASALAWLVKTWWATVRLQPIATTPARLRFICLPRQGRGYGGGNPGLGVFPNRRAGARGHRDHYCWNIRANWLLHDALQKALASRQSQFSDLREVEAALFQLGA